MNDFCSNNSYCFICNGVILISKKKIKKFLDCTKITNEVELNKILYYLEGSLNISFNLTASENTNNPKNHSKIYKIIT